ncbi:MAG: anti-anti-sigma factor [Burkholderiales bacterium PBB1]|nr:MAG: anti-anti-sigma factor [Burkholderiales bacterium PBB1]
MLTLPTTIGLTEANAVMRPLADAIAREPAGPLNIDAAGLQQFDSSALAVLLECRRLAEKSGRSLQLRNAPPRLSQLARLYGVAELLGIASAQDAPPTA